MFKMCCGDCGKCWYVGNPRTCKCLNETPQREWVGLTDDEQIALLKDSNGKTRHWLVWQVEDKLKQKNGYAEENT